MLSSCDSPQPFIVEDENQGEPMNKCISSYGWNSRLNDRDRIFFQDGSAVQIKNLFQHNQVTVHNFSAIAWVGNELTGLNYENELITIKDKNIRTIALSEKVYFSDPQLINHKGTSYRRKDIQNGLALFINDKSHEGIVLDLQSGHTKHFRLQEESNLQTAYSIRLAKVDKVFSHIIVVHQKFQELSPAKIIHEAKLYNFEKGQQDYIFTAMSKEFRYLPDVLNGKILVRNRYEDFLCPYWLSESGDYNKVEGCHRDSTFEIYSKDYAVKTFHPFISYASEIIDVTERNILKRQQGFSGLEAGKSTDHATYYSRLEQSGEMHIVKLDDTGKVQVSSPNIFCKTQSLIKGKSITAKVEGHSVHGFYFIPTVQSPPKSLIVFLHGGPYDAYSDLQSDKIKELTSKGHAILLANVRGTPGYGRRYLELGFSVQKNMHSLMLSDARALADQFYAQFPKMKTIKTILLGESWGGYLSLLDQAQSVPNFDASISKAGVCDVNINFENAVFGAPNIHISKLTNPATSLMQMYITGSVDYSLEKPRNLCTHEYLNPEKILVLHGAKDKRARYAHIDAMLKANSGISSKIYKKDGHWLKPALYAKEIDEFIEKLN